MTAELDADWINVNFTEDFSATTARDMDAQYRAAGKDPCWQAQNHILLRRGAERGRGL